MTAITVENISEKTQEAGRSLTAAVPQSVSEPARGVVDKISAGVQWYLEQWEDVIEEAKAMTAVNLEEIALADFLAGLSEAPVASDIPGRLRLRPETLKGRIELAHEVTEALASFAGISEVHVSSLTGSILIFYDKKQFDSKAALLQAIEHA